MESYQMVFQVDCEANFHEGEGGKHPLIFHTPYDLNYNNLIKAYETHFFILTLNYEDCTSRSCASTIGGTISLSALHPLTLLYVSGMFLA